MAAKRGGPEVERPGKVGLPPGCSTIAGLSEPDVGCQDSAGVYINVGCVVLDCVQVVIGDRALLGPGVHIYAATHPLDPARGAPAVSWPRRSASAPTCG